jgi:ADP-heptose:LPS heptosyltransferase
MLNILIVRACAIGDFLTNLPALKALQDSQLGARCSLVGSPATLEIAREFVAVDEIFSIEADPWRRLFYEPISGLAFDSAIVWMKDTTVAENLRRSGITRVKRADPFPAFGHAADHLLRTLSLQRPPLPDRWLPTSEDIIINPGSGSTKKIWPYFADLERRAPRVHQLPLSLTLRQIARMLKNCRAFVGNDSGITHLAAYLGCPTIALFGPTDPRVWGPWGRRSRVIWKSRLEDITADEVLVALRSR